MIKQSHSFSCCPFFHFLPMKAGLPPGCSPVGQFLRLRAAQGTDGCFRMGLAHPKDLEQLQLLHHPQHQSIRPAHHPPLNSSLLACFKAYLICWSILSASFLIFSWHALIKSTSWNKKYTLVRDSTKVKGKAFCRGLCPCEGPGKGNKR